jgi:DNA-binding transcriptional LysR family regulator
VDGSFDVKTTLELRHLRVLVAVVENGGYTRAARALGVAQSTVSEAVAALERALGGPVLERGRKTPVLTAAGAALLPHAREMLRLEGEALSAVAAVSEQVRGSLLLGVNESVSTYVLPGPLAALRAEWPNVRTVVSIGECAEIRERVQRGEIELGMVLELPSAGREEERVLSLGGTELVLFVHPAHPLAGRAAKAERLAEEELYLSGLAGSYHQLLRRYLEADGFTRPRITPVGSVEAVKRHVTGGSGGVGALPAFAVRAELASGAVARVRPDPAQPSIVLKALLPPGSAPSPVADALLRLVGAAELG